MAEDRTQIRMIHVSVLQGMEEYNVAQTAPKTDWDIFGQGIQGDW